MYTKRTNLGFSFVEVLVAVAVIAMIATISAASFKNFSRSSALKVASEEVYSAFTSARNETLASSGGTVFGVHIGTSSVTRFTGSTYSVGDTTNRTYTFESGVTATSSFISDGIDIVFSRLTGRPSASGTIFLITESGDATTTMHIYDSGLIEY